jgi:hypothetical protein
MKSYIDIHNGNEKAAKKFFTVIKPLDMNSNQECLVSVQKFKSGS